MLNRLQKEFIASCDFEGSYSSSKRCAFVLIKDRLKVICTNSINPKARRKYNTELMIWGIIVIASGGNDLVIVFICFVKSFIRLGLDFSVTKSIIQEDEINKAT